MQNIFYNVILMFGLLLAVEKDPSGLAAQRLKNIGLQNVQFSFEKEGYTQDYFSIRLLKKAMYNGVMLPEETKLYIEDTQSDFKKSALKSDEIKIVTLPSGKSVRYQGALCSRMDLVHGDLLQCTIAENMKYKSLKIPKGTEVLFDPKLKKNNVAVPVIVESLTEDIILNHKTYPARSDTLRITPDGDLTTEGVKELYLKLRPGAG